MKYLIISLILLLSGCEGRFLPREIPCEKRIERYQRENRHLSDQLNYYINMNSILLKQLD